MLKTLHILNSDAMRCHIKVINAGGVRTSIEAGEVTYADLFQILPFENEVYIVTMLGSTLKSYITNTSGIYYWGIYLDYVNDNEEYQMAIVDYAYQSYSFDNYRTGEYTDTNNLIRDVFIDYVVASFQ